MITGPKPPHVRLPEDISPIIGTRESDHHFFLSGSPPVCRQLSGRILFEWGSLAASMEIAPRPKVSLGVTKSFCMGFI